MSNNNTLLDKEIKFWYDKLRQEGFKDIEQSNSINKSTPSSTKDYQTTINYFDKAQEFIYVYHFKQEVDKTIWQLHIEGKSLRNIADHIGKERGYVWSHIKKIEVAFKAWVKHGIS